MWIRDLILGALYPTLKVAGKLHWPIDPKDRLVTVEDMEVIRRKHMQPGDILLTRSRGALSNLLIPGKFWTHVAMVSAIDDLIIESVDPWVRMVPLSVFLQNKDFVTIQRCQETTPAEAAQAAKVFERLLGKPYDYRFHPNILATYCAEGIVWSYREVVPEIICDSVKILGVETWVPSAFWMDRRWKELYTSSSFSSSMRLKLSSSSSIPTT